MSGKSERGPVEAVWRFLGSYGLAISMLVCLFLLTLFGTLYQVDYGLYQAKKRFFESWFLWREVGGVSVPFFPAGVACMSVLAVNMTVGGLLRLRLGAHNLGVTIIHLGIAFLLVSSLVKLVTAEEGHLTLYEGESSNEFLSYHDWEVTVWEPKASGELEEHVIPHERLADLTGERSRTFESPDLPFSLVLSGFQPNCRVMPVGPMWQPAGSPVEGYGILAEPVNTTSERNVAGLHVEVRTPDGTVENGILWGRERAPWTFEAGGRTWAASLRHERFSMPFTIRLEDFVKEDHPGISMAKAFRSDVTKIEAGHREVVRIEMNEPLRDGGLVLFQSSWGPQDAGPGERLFSSFSVTRNVSDKWPEYSMWVVTVGMLLAFGRKLRRFLGAQEPSAARARAKDEVAANGSPLEA